VGSTFADVAAKIEAGERLSDADALVLESDRDIVALGMLADAERGKRHGSRATFLRVCDLSVGGPSGGIPEGAGEVRLTSVPASLEQAVTQAADARDAAGTIPVSGFSLADLERLGEPLPVVLKALRDAGLELVTFAPLDKLKDAEGAMEAAADAGLGIARVTLDRVPELEWNSLCRRLEAIQRGIQSLRAFAPLPRTLDVAQPTTGYADVKRVALARILVSNIETIQVDWSLYGPKLAQVALLFGADDLDSVSAADDDSRGHRRSPLEEIRRSISSAGFEPAERDARFRPL
jgi:aminodeoxyfutalosine synthase